MMRRDTNTSFTFYKTDHKEKNMKNVQLDHTSHVENQKDNSGNIFPLSYLAHNIDTPTNIGSLFRIADALGIEQIFLTGTSISPPNTKLRKTSRASEKHVNFSVSECPLPVIANLKILGYKIIGLEITSSSIDINHLNINKNEKICLILGSEKSGICQELLNLTDVCIYIPMLGHNSSMNVANACAIASYEITRQLKQ